MVWDSRFHRWRDTQRVVVAAEVVLHVVNRQCVRVSFHLLAANSSHKRGHEELTTHNSAIKAQKLADYLLLVDS